LREYAGQGSEPAFAELVQRHVNLVYSAALRHAGIPAQAEEITQVVFVILARKAGGLHADTVLEAWLYETTRLASISYMRGERRRQFREQESCMQSDLQESVADSVWEQLAPLLDEAMARLGKKDREAVVLRFFKDKKLREVAAALNVNDAAAQKRVGRALEKLRKFFSKRGVASTTAVIAGAISANAIQAPPAALAKTVTAVAIAKGAAASSSTLVLIQGALKLMAWSKAKMAIVTGAGVLLAVGTATVAVKTRQNNNNPLAPVLTRMVNEAIDGMFTFPKLTNNVPEGGAPKVSGLLLWVLNDATNNPGKSFHQLSYHIVIGSGQGKAGIEERDLGKPYILHYGSRTALATLIVRPNYESSKEAFMVVTYFGGGQLLDRRITLQWLDKQNKWGRLRESGPDPRDVRE
jgi:RNA polymerase sigma factor (sigma-70 family)